ncbi:MAG: hypothetical protein EPN93_00840 [Spirochaetes bacterium]|nr:MAG: hypothetical protein EPN93_00840 [Spirochaetota bacterium]
MHAEKYPLLLAAMICCAMLFAAPPARAVGVSAGLATWYADWDTESQSPVNPALMYGPVLGLDLGKKWSLNSVFLMGNFKWETPTGDVYDFRYDSDTTLNYAVFRWLKVFAGFKYMRYDEDYKPMYVPFAERDISIYSYGPGLGLGLTIPVSNSLFVLGNFSGLYLWGKFSGDSTRFISKGYNAALSLAYYLPWLPMTITAGYRYQLIKETSDVYTGGYFLLKFSGFTFSAVYHFSAGDDE